ncbi:hypothetical protein H4R18_003608 [Coemansia javaensis]|uniref:DUF788-domain-containing protein n=1 Tax=Coemansia javaensis TaxID=2761396 RepID=A0A9W8H6I9_9FUNG|nr:hypothetical protein H4R18_003608 [Coemansia javaensis]
MANQSAKRITQANAARLSAVTRGALAVNAVYLLVRVVLQRSSSSSSLGWGEAVLYLATAGAEALVIRNFYAMARPRHNSGGVVVDAGADLGAPGLTSYMFDYVYISWFVHLLSLATRWAWAVYLVIPGYVAYYALPYLRQFMLPSADGSAKPSATTAAAAAADDAAAKERKRQEKKDRKRQRVKYVRG